MTAAAPERSRLGGAAPIAALLAVAAAGWALTARWMTGMGAGPSSGLGELSWFALSWTVMMAAMMLPTVAPTVAAFDRRRASAGAPGAFAAGYLVAWLAAGLVGYAAIGAVRSLAPALLELEETGRYVAAAAIAGAGLYQLTTAKRSCLRRCRERHAFLTEHWRTGRLGAVRMGVEHGGFCVGCCWALMVALFALGAMSLTWMVVVAALIAAERLLPWGRAARRVVAVSLVVLATVVALGPDPVLDVLRDDEMEMR